MKGFKTYQLAKELHAKGRSVRLANPYKDQFQRALLSIPLNLAEGSAKESMADRRRFYQIAFGSCREVQAIVDVMDLHHLKNDSDKLAAHLFQLIRSLAPQ